MTTSHSTRGFTLIELLVVIAIIGILPGLLLPAVQINREKENQVMGLADLRAVENAEGLFRALDADHDLLDDYGTLAELGAAGLLGAALASGVSNVYGFTVITSPPPGPGFEVRAVPLSQKPARLRFFANQTALETFSESGFPGPNSTPLTPGDECSVPPDSACEQLVQSTAFEALIALNTLSGADQTTAALDFLAAEDPVPHVYAALDGNFDGQLGFEEALAGDLLGAARAAVASLGLDPGPDFGADSELRAILDSYQADVYGVLELDLDAPQPERAISDLSVDEGSVVALLLAFQAGPVVPAMSRAWLGLLVFALGALGAIRLQGRAC